jgi:hypothetical protein
MKSTTDHNEIIAELKRGNTIIFNCLNLGRFTQMIQIEIFQAMEPVQFVELNLSNAKHLTDQQLAKILIKSASQLKIINLSNCQKLTTKTLANIAKYCLNIEEIIISNKSHKSELKLISASFAKKSGNK